VPLNKVWFLIYFCLYLSLYTSYRLYNYLFITSLVHSLQSIVHRIFIYFHINPFTYLPIYPFTNSHIHSSTHSLIYTHQYNNSEYLATGRYGTGVLPLRGRWDTSCGNCFHIILHTFTHSHIYGYTLYSRGYRGLPLRGKRIVALTPCL
jgi:hypothetical protein